MHKNQSTQHIPTVFFDKKNNAWLEKEITSSMTKISNLSQLTFVSYNVWFEPHNFEERGVELRKIMQESNADFICLQEVTEPFFIKLLSSDWVREKYYVSKVKVSRYFTVILSKIPCQFYYVDFITGMGRYLLYATFEVNGQSAAVATVHLESLSNQEFRKDQLAVKFRELEPYPIAFIMGDFNLYGYSETRHFDPKYIDIWKFLKKDDPGYTMPRDEWFQAWRPDKVLMKKNGKCKPVIIERMGTEPIPKYRNQQIDKDTSNKVSARQNCLQRCLDKLFSKKKGTVQSAPPESTVTNPVSNSKQSNQALEGASTVMTPSDHHGLFCKVEILSSDQVEFPTEVPQKEAFLYFGSELFTEQNKSFLNAAAQKMEAKGIVFNAFEDVRDGLEYMVFRFEEWKSLTLITDMKGLETIMKVGRLCLMNPIHRSRDDKNFGFNLIVTTRDEEKKARTTLRLIGMDEKNYHVALSVVDILSGMGI